MSSTPEQSKEQADNKQMTGIVERNIQALLQHRQQEEAQRSREERIADTITRFAGSMAFVYIHLFFFGLWIVWNVGWLALPPFDESLVVLAMFASVEAIFLSTFVLISQNRMNAQADKRAELDLQVSLLAEHEITRLVTLVRSIAQKLDVEEGYDPALDELALNVKPEKVLDTVEKHKEKWPAIQLSEKTNA